MADELTLNLTKSNVIIINRKNSPIGPKPNIVSIHQHFLPSLSTVTAAKISLLLLMMVYHLKLALIFWQKNFLELLEFSPKLNRFLLSLHCLAYIMQFFIPIFNMEYWPEVQLTNLIIMKYRSYFTK